MNKMKKVIWIVLFALFLIIKGSPTEASAAPPRSSAGSADGWARGAGKPPCAWPTQAPGRGNF